MSICIYISIHTYTIYTLQITEYAMLNVFIPKFYLLDK